MIRSCPYCFDEHSFELKESVIVECDCGARFDLRLIEFWTPPVKEKK